MFRFGLLFNNRSEYITDVAGFQQLQTVAIQKLWEQTGSSQTGHTVKFHLLHKIPQSCVLQWIDLSMCVNLVRLAAAKSI